MTRIGKRKKTKIERSVLENLVTAKIFSFCILKKCFCINFSFVMFIIPSLFPCTFQRSSHAPRVYTTGTYSVYFSSVENKRKIRNERKIICFECLCPSPIQWWATKIIFVRICFTIPYSWSNENPFVGLLTITDCWLRSRVLFLFETHHPIRETLHFEKDWFAAGQDVAIWDHQSKLVLRIFCVTIVCLGFENNALSWRRERY